MSADIRIKKGLNINLEGAAEKITATADPAETIALKPDDFKGLTPKLSVKQGDEVKAGSPVFYDKQRPEIVIPSPVSGEVVEIVRGDKRKIMEVKILADKEVKHLDFGKTNPAQLNREQVVEKLLASGAWSLLRQRPYGIIPSPTAKPKAVFISAFDTAPLATDNDFAVHGQTEVFQAGIDAIAKLTDGKVHLNVNGVVKPSEVFTNCKNVQINKFSGPHPAGNVGIQIHHISPINKGEAVWYLNPQDVLIIGRLFTQGVFDATRLVAVTGSQVVKPKYYKMIAGSSVKNVLKGNVKEGKSRYISGNVLTGTKIPAEGHLGFYDAQVTVIPEGDEPEFMGWLAPGFDKMSASRTFFSWLTPGKKYALNSNQHGEHRAYVVTGQYESVLPMDIYPVQLIKAIMIEDLEAMEGLGIYEVSEEDFALCEFVCTSKTEVQKIIRQGLDTMLRES